MFPQTVNSKAEAGGFHLDNLVRPSHKRKTTKRAVGVAQLSSTVLTQHAWNLRVNPPPTPPPKQKREDVLAEEQVLCETGTAFSHDPDEECW